MRSNLIGLFVLLAVIATSVTAVKDIDLFPGEQWTSGYIRLADHDKALFYYLFKCRNKSISKPPLLIWLEGGPGYTSAAGVYMHGGPYIIDNKTQEIVRNKHAWNEIADVLFIDQPAGTHFSFSDDISKICTTMECVTEDLYSFLLKFYAMYPAYKHRDFYISGISYAGHYVPAFARRVVQDGKDFIPFKGIITFNGAYDTLLQSYENFGFLYDRGLVSALTKHIIGATLVLCKAAMVYEIPLIPLICAQIDLIALKIMGFELDPYNIEHKSGPDIYETKILPYLNEPEVQKALGVNQKFGLFNWTVYDKLLDDGIVEMYPELSLELKNNFKVWMVHGEEDFVCSARGGLQVAEHIQWDGQDEFVNTPFKDWNMNGTPLGQIKKHKNLAFVTVAHTGHSIFFQQREFGLEILKEFMNSE